MALKVRLSNSHCSLYLERLNGWLSWCLPWCSALVGAETMTNPLQGETRTSKCMLAAVIINREVDNERFRIAC